MAILVSSSPLPCDPSINGDGVGQGVGATTAVNNSGADDDNEIFDVTGAANTDIDMTVRTGVPPPIHQRCMDRPGR